MLFKTRAKSTWTIPRARCQTRVPEDTPKGCLKLSQYQPCYSRNKGRRGPDEPVSRTIERTETSCRLARKLQNKSREQYAVEQIACHVTTKTGPRYVIRCYGYSSRDDNIEPPEHLPKHFVDTYWRCSKRQSAPTKRSKDNDTRYKSTSPTKSNNEYGSLRIARQST